MSKITPTHNINQPHKIIIVTRHSNKQLYDFSSKFYKSLNYPCYTITNSTADGYIESCINIDKLLNKNVEIVINIDDDAFVSYPQRINEMIEYMKLNNYDYSGIPDGGLRGQPRNHNPCSMNPFFNIFFIKCIRDKMNDNITPIDFSVNLTRQLPFDLFDRDYKYNYVEPYYGLFFHMLKKCKVLFLCNLQHYNPSEDHSTTILKNEKGQEILKHTWYARYYNKKPEETKRINNVIKNVEKMNFY